MAFNLAVLSRDILPYLGVLFSQVLMFQVFVFSLKMNVKGVYLKMLCFASAPFKIIDLKM